MNIWNGIMRERGMKEKVVVTPPPPQKKKKS